MNDLAATLETMRQQIGKSGITYQIEVDKWLIRQVCNAVDDPNPLWQDQDYASERRYQGIVAPPWLLVAAIFARQEPETRPVINHLYLDGGGEWEFYLPIRPGDVITVETRLVDLNGREGKSGPLYFETIETRWTNQRGELVGKNLSILITR
jgi:acyl dehydratase